MQDDNDTSSNKFADDHLPVAGESITREDSVPYDTAGDSGAPYQDDLTTDESATDPILDEDGDDPADELGVPPSEFRDELDRYDLDNDETEDARETMEDRDEDDDNAASATQ